MDLDKLLSRPPSGELCVVIKGTYKLFDKHIVDLREKEITDDIVDAYLDQISTEINVCLHILYLYI